MVSLTVQGGGPSCAPQPPNTLRVHYECTLATGPEVHACARTHTSTHTQKGHQPRLISVPIIACRLPRGRVCPSALKGFRTPQSGGCSYRPISFFRRRLLFFQDLNFSVWLSCGIREEEKLQNNRPASGRRVYPPRCPLLSDAVLPGPLAHQD